jgi:Protein of unknown function (DUF2971)
MTLRPLPKSLYKYRPFNVYALRSLTEAEVYYSDPRRFNDPLDCNPTIKIDVDRASLEHLCYNMLRNTGVDKKEAESIINNLRYMSTEYGDYKTDANVEKYLKEQLLAAEIKRLFYEEMGRKGVFSLSETWKSPLMWSHYADDHRGICLEYDTAQIPHPDIAAVDYRSRRSVKASDLIEWKMQASSEAEQRVYNTYFFAKSPQWQYEKEWRDIRQSSGGRTPSGFPITAVYFGLRCDPAVTTSVVKMFSRNESISFFEIYPLNDSFSLRRRRVDRNEIEACGIRSAELGIPSFWLSKDVVLAE